ncbi:MAG: hypothetical protein WA784_05600 [Albidovulum sp.]
MSANKAPVLLAAMMACAAPVPVWAEAPLSAIDWLSQSVATPASLARPTTQADPNSGRAALPAPITVTPLANPGVTAVGLISAQRAGLPRDLWGPSRSTDIARLIRAEQPDTLPAVRQLMNTLLITELSPPHDGDPTGALFVARIDKLLDLGALDPALALLELLGKPNAESFRRWFDISLLLGQEDRACEVMAETPQIAPTFPARIFCLARGGDWDAAALSLRTGQTLQTIDPEMGALLERFLDPELFEGEDDLPLPARPSPLVLRLMEAIGQPLPTTTLPVAFAQADLRSNSGWKTQIEAAERLTRMGAIPPNRLLGLYTERRAAASGGVWERVKAVQALDDALKSGDPAKIGAALGPVWSQMVKMELEVPFADLFGAELASADLSGPAGSLAFRIGLLSSGYEKIAITRSPANPAEAFLIGLAKGDLSGIRPPDQLGVAIKAAFATKAVPDEGLRFLLSEDKLGEALLKAIDKATKGASGDLRDVTNGLALLRQVGLENTARRTGLELMLLERRG